MPAEPEEASAAAEAKMLPHTPQGENISEDEEPHLASEKNKLCFAMGAKGGTAPLPRDSTGVKMRKQKTPTQQKEQSFHTGRDTGTGAHAQGTHLEPLNSWLSDSTDRHLVPESCSGMSTPS